MIKLGSTYISTAKLGATQVSKIYLGETEFWSGFSPTSFAGLELWLDGSDASNLYDSTTGGSLVAADGMIARWEDKSGNGRHVTQSTSGKRPLRKTSVQNSKDAVFFDGNDDEILRTSGAMSILKNVPGATAFIVRKWISAATNRAQLIIAKGDGGANFARLLVGAGVTANKSRIVSRNIDGDASATLTGTANVSPVAFEIETAIVDYANSNAYHFINGSSNGSSTSYLTDANSSNTDSLGITIGSGFNGAYFYGHIAEVIIYKSALSATDRQTVEAYLNAKYAIY